jgi:hypothetical protein
VRRLIPDHETRARARVIAGLRQAADYLDAHPGVPVSEPGWDLLAFPAPGTRDPAGRAEVDRVAAVLGVRPGTAVPGGHYRAVRAFGPVTYQFIHITAREQAAHRALMSYSGAVIPAGAGEDGPRG